MTSMPEAATEWQSFDQLTADKLYELLRFRQDIFVVEQASPYPDLDGLDQGAWHLLLRVDGVLTGYLRLIPSPPVGQDRPGRGRRCHARSRARAQADGRGAAILQHAISGAPGSADGPSPFGAVLSKLRVRTDR